MRRWAVFALAFSAAPLWLKAAPVLASGGPPVVEDLFKWGEYDSLIRVLEPVLSDPGFRTGPARADSLHQAKGFLYVGVAYFATGKRDQAEDAFARACELDSAIKIDRFYVSEQIAANFEGIAAAVANRRHRASPTPMPLRASGSEAPASDTSDSAHGDRAGAPSPQRVRESRTWIWWGLGSVAVMAGAFGGVLYLTTRAPAEHVTVVDLQ